jgi:hypothetical protein
MIHNGKPEKAGAAERAASGPFAGSPCEAYPSTLLLQ